MKQRKLCMVALTTLTWILLLGAAVDAQEGITVTPSQLTVAGTQGTVETRTLLLQATGSITSVQAIPLDLTGADGDAVLPAEAIQVALPADEVQAGSLLTIPVRLDLQGAPSGRFSGDLLIDFHSGSHTVPVTVTIKDPWTLPLLVLIVGVALGVGVSAYRVQGRPRDKVLVRVGQLRAQMRGDAELAQPFRARIEALLVDVEAALQAEKWQASETAVEQAETVWILWRRGYTDWLEQLRYHDELVGRLKDEPDVPYTQAVRRGLEDALRGAPDLAGPDKLREWLGELAQQINRYLQLNSRLDELNDLRNRLSGDSAETWRLKALGLQRQLEDARPDDQAAYQALHGETQQAIVDVQAAIAEQERRATITQGEEVVFAKAPRGSGAILSRLLGPAPSARSLTTEEQAAGARIRLRWFTWASYAIVVALLAGAGFGELYIANPTFGANAWGDYFALLAWGFGAEATRAAVAQMVRSWGLPGVE